jgi:hypothetical protein
MSSQSLPTRFPCGAEIGSPLKQAEESIAVAPLTIRERLACIAAGCGGEGRSSGLFVLTLGRSTMARENHLPCEACDTKPQTRRCDFHRGQS